MKKNNSRSKFYLPIDGVLLLDKPQGLSSNAALQQVKRLCRIRKAGHSGSLDPLASGLLPICFNEATKFTRFLLDADKHYQTTMRLGVRTDTSDSEGKITAEYPHPLPKFSEQHLEDIFEKFRGNILQTPSMFSALKHQGQPLYKLARQGVEIERTARPITIKSLKLLDYTHTDLISTITLDIHASKGTYIRTIVDDLGQALGCWAHVIELRRLGVGPFTETQMISLPKLEAILAEHDDDFNQYEGLERDEIDKLLQKKLSKHFERLKDYLLPIEDAVIGMDELIISESASFYLKQGQAVSLPYAPKSGWVKLMVRDKGFLGVGEVQEDGKVAPRRLLSSEINQSVQLTSVPCN